MATPRTGNPRGRPQKDFLADPERYAIALALALMALGKDERSAYRLAAIQLVGREVETVSRGPARRRGKGVIPGGLWVQYERARAPGQLTTTIDGKADTLRRKYNDHVPFSPAEAEWLRCMWPAIAAAINPKDVARCCAWIAEKTARVGEAAFGYRLISAMGSSPQKTLLPEHSPTV